jgi:hypothetical protein
VAFIQAEGAGGVWSTIGLALSIGALGTYAALLQ